MIKRLLPCLFLLGSVFANGQTKINFDGGWKFRLGHAADPAKDFNYSIPAIFSKSGKTDDTALGLKFDDSKWRSLNLPHDWAVELPFQNSPNFDVQSHGYKPVGGLYPETSIGWYRKHFTVAKADSGSRFRIQFDGIFRDAKVWVNGFYLGNNESGYVGISYDLTDYLNFDADNVITVRVDATQYEGWFYEGAGIYRHVWLHKFNNLHLAENGVYVRSEVKDNKASILIEASVQNQDLLGKKGTIYSYLTDRNGKKIAKTAEKFIVLKANGSTVVNQELSISNPRLWSVDEPYLYKVITLVKSEGKVVDSLKQRIGIRTFRFDGEKGFFLNGKHLKLKGVNNHQDHAGVGSALPDYLQYYRIALLKEMGTNAYRSSHHAPTPELLDACDSLGMLVLDEQRLLNSSPEYMDQFERLLKRDRNRASVFLWSIGNEEGWIQTNSVGKRIAQSLLAKQQELDPSRTSTYAADVPNVFKGVNEVIPVRGFNYRQSAVADYHRDHPSQPIIGTEMGSTVTTRGVLEKDTVNAYLPDQDITAPWWASRAEEWWKLAAENDYWAGGFIWTGMDYRGEPTPFKWPNINSHFGVMDMCGFPKNIYYYYQSWWTDKDVLHISPHWNWPNKIGQPITVWVNSNADDVELFLNGKSLGRKTMPRNSHLKWEVVYTPGKLEAIANKNGKVLTAKVETTGTAAEVVLTPYKTTMLADGKDAAVINVSIIDKEGREVPNANQLIKFSLKGDAKIIGVGNGDPSSHEADICLDGNWQRSTFNGKAQVIIQSGKNPGMIQFEATADGLWKGSTDILTVAPDQTVSFIRDPKFELKGEAAKTRSSSKMLGADISFLPELEAKGIKFSDQGVDKDPLLIMKDHGFNYVRLRIFNEPANEKGYAPGKGFCDLAYTKQMAKRVKAAGMKLLLDFHYSDYWADPGKQFKPKSWEGLSPDQLKNALYEYTRNALLELQAQGTTPDMVQVGNEINHGMVWPEGSVANLSYLAELLRAGYAAVKSVDPKIVSMLHIALGGQNDESVFFIDNMMARGVQFDVLGQSYYPKWHGTLSDLERNLNDLVKRYEKDVIVVEYSQHKKEVNKIAFELPGSKGKGTCIWEPLNTWEAFFDREGRSNEYLNIYDEVSKKYLQKN